jgi:hypothetical protein
MSFHVIPPNLETLSKLQAAMAARVIGGSALHPDGVAVRAHLTYFHLDYSVLGFQSLQSLIQPGRNLYHRRAADKSNCDMSVGSS